MKKIAIDLDGVVFDTENLYRVYAEIYDVDVKKKDSLIDNTKRLYQNRYDWPLDEKQNFYKRYSKEIMEKGNITSGADIVLKKLSNNYELIVVTSRGDDEVVYAREFFKRIGFSDIKIYNGQSKKIDILLKEKVDYMIDDDPDICINTANNNIKALYFKNSAANPIKENAYLKNVNNWGEIYKYIVLGDNLNETRSN